MALPAHDGLRELPTCVSEPQASRIERRAGTHPRGVVYRRLWRSISSTKSVRVGGRQNTRIFPSRIPRVLVLVYLEFRKTPGVDRSTSADRASSLPTFPRPTHRDKLWG